MEDFKYLYQEHIRSVPDKYLSIDWAILAFYQVLTGNDSGAKDAEKLHADLSKVKKVYFDESTFKIFHMECRVYLEVKNKIEQFEQRRSIEDERFIVFAEKLDELEKRVNRNQN